MPPLTNQRTGNAKSAGKLRATGHFGCICLKVHRDSLAKRETQGNSVSRIPAISVLLSNSAMRDIDQIRRDNMLAIEREIGGATAAAERSGMSQAQWTNLRSGAIDSKTGKRRGMRKETARRIEQSAGKPLGWLDAEHEYASTERQAPEQPPRTGEQPAQYRIDNPLSNDERQILALCRKLSADDKRRLLHYLEVKVELDQFPTALDEPPEKPDSATPAGMRDAEPNLGPALVDLTGT